MPAINPNLVPTVTPGDLFTQLAGGDTTLSVRWLTPKDPVYYEILNRPLADIVLRQLIISKSVGQLQESLGHQVLYPYIIQPTLGTGTTPVDVPLGLIWDMHLSIPKKWENVRLAKVKRISGTNDGTGTYDGKLRLIFTANQQGSTPEVAIAYADYIIDSTLTYQISRLSAPPTGEETIMIDTGERDTIGGFIIFKTQSVTDITVSNFLDAAAPPSDTTVDTDNLYVTPAEYEITDSVPGDASGDFNSLTVSHGTGMLESSAWSAIPSLSSDVQSWVEAFNYPYDLDANRTSTSGTIIPNGMFREFNITAPAGDASASDVTGTTYPVWISRIERVGDTGYTLRFYFATYNVTSSASTELVEFATMDLASTGEPGDIVEIVPASNLQLATGSDAANWGQHFGRGHAVLSSLWSGTSTDISDFFDTFALISDDPADISFSKTATRISSFGISRIPKYTPTIGQAAALAGSTSRLETPVPPSSTNLYVTESDQGGGDEIDLEAETGVTPHAAIGRYGKTGSLCHRMVVLETDATQVSSTDTDAHYDTEILPRLTILLGRAPQMFDFWYNGTELFFFNGDTWQSP